MSSKHQSSQAGDVKVEGEQVIVEDVTIAGDCVFAGMILVGGDVTIDGNVRFEGPVGVAPGARITINGRAWVPKTPPNPRTEGGAREG